MIKLVPSRPQWNGWSLVAKLTAVGAYLSIFSFAIMLGQCAQSLYIPRAEVRPPRGLAESSAVITATQAEPVGSAPPGDPERPNAPTSAPRGSPEPAASAPRQAAQPPRRGLSPDLREQSRLDDEQVRVQLAYALRDGEVDRALAILGRIGVGDLKRDECERVYSFCLKNHRLPQALAATAQCWDGPRRDQALADIEREQLKDQ